MGVTVLVATGVGIYGCDCTGGEGARKAQRMSSVAFVLRCLCV